MENIHIDPQALAAGVPPPVKRPAGFFTLKVAVWGALAAVAAGYLALIVIKPGLLASRSGADNDPTRAVSLAETQDLRDNIEKLQVDVSRIKTDLAEKSEQDKAIATRLSVLEDVKRGGPVAALPAAAVASAPPAASPGSTLVQIPATAAAAKANLKKTAGTLAKNAIAAAAPAAVQQAIQPLPAAVAAPAAIITQPAAVAQPAAISAPAPAPPANAAAALAPPLANPDAGAAPGGIKLINGPLSQSSAASKAAPAPVAPVQSAVGQQAAAAPANAAEALAPKFETGSVQNPAVAAAPPAAAPAKPIGVYIGSGPSVDSLRLSWSLLADRNAESLKPLEPRYTTGIDGNGINYGLVAGPLRSVADAQKLCKDLAAKAVTCRVGDFTGEAL